MPTFEYTIDEGYFYQAMERIQHGRWLPRLIPIGVAGLFFCLAVGMAWAKGQSNWGFAFALSVGVGVLLYLFRRQMNHFAWRQMFDAAPHKGTRHTVTFTPDGLTAAGEIDNGHIKWQAYTSAVVFNDGIVLYRGIHGVWLPAEAMIAGTFEEAATMVREHIPNCRSA